MNRFLVALVACVIGLGFYQECICLSTGSDGQKTIITITVDQEIIRKYEKRAMEKVREVMAGTEKSKVASPRP